MVSVAGFGLFLRFLFLRIPLGLPFFSDHFGLAAPSSLRLRLFGWVRADFWAVRSVSGLRGSKQPGSNKIGLSSGAHLSPVRHKQIERVFPRLQTMGQVVGEIRMIREVVPGPRCSTPTSRTQENIPDLRALPGPRGATGQPHTERDLFSQGGSLSAGVKRPLVLRGERL